jgi:hypothetical protein
VPEFTCHVCKKVVQISDGQEKIMRRIGAQNTTCSYTCALALMNARETGDPVPLPPPIDKSTVH